MSESKQGTLIAFRITDADLVEEMDRICEDQQIKRSELIRAALVAYVRGDGGGVRSLKDVIEDETEGQDPQVRRGKKWFDAAVQETVNQALPDAPPSEIVDGK